MNKFGMNLFWLRSRTSALAVVTLLGLSIGLSGCGGSSSTATVTQPTGTIAGSLRDSVTQQPIVGALLDIGVATATTNAQGEFVMSNVVVPVDAANSGMAPSFPVNVNLRNVTSPVNMASATATPRYPDFYYKSIPITFTSLYTTAASATTATPVTGLIATVDFTVGKLAATITGVVADSSTLQPVAAGYTVKLVSIGSTNSATGSSGTGAAGNIVGSTTTDASGNFTFANIESLRNFRIDAWNAAQTMKGSGIGALNVGTAVTSPADGETKTLAIQQNNAVLVASTDVLAPTIVSATPEEGSDNAPGTTSVVFTFSEPILQTALTSTSSSVPTGLYSTVAVNHTGAKASNITRSLSWNATSTQLTVTVPTVAASKYTVSLAGTGTALKDASNLAVTNIATAGKGVLSFTTNGSTTPAAPGIVTPVNLASLNNLGVSAPILNWAPVSGANAYNVYRSTNTAGVAGPYLMLPVALPASTLFSDYTDTALPFSSGQSMLTYSYVVRSVSLDKVESADSAVVTVQDMVKPTATIPVVAPATTYTITFSEPVAEASATTLANYAIAIGGAPVGSVVPTVTAAVLNPGLTTVTITLSSIAIALETLTITGVTDIAGNTMTVATGPL